MCHRRSSSSSWSLSLSSPLTPRPLVFLIAKLVFSFFVYGISPEGRMGRALLGGMFHSNPQYIYGNFKAVRGAAGRPGASHPHACIVFRRLSSFVLTTYMGIVLMDHAISILPRFSCQSLYALDRLGLPGVHYDPAS